MKKIDFLIKKARAAAKSALNYLTSDDDGFITAIVDNPAPYAIKQADGVDGYDTLAILNELSKEDWGDYEDT